MPSSTTSAVLPSNPLTKFLPMLLPVLFLLMQHGSGSGGFATWRVSPQNMKIALRIVACCIASIATLAATLPLVGTGPTHPIYTNTRASNQFNGAWSVYRWSGCAVSVVNSDVYGGDGLQQVLARDDVLQVMPNAYESGSSGSSSGRATPPAAAGGSLSLSSAASSARAWSPKPGTPSTSCDTPSSGPIVAMPDDEPASTPKYVYRHDPYSFRGFRRLDVVNNTASVTFQVGAGEGPKTAVTVATGALLKSQQYPLDLRRRGRRPDSNEGGAKATKVNAKAADDASVAADAAPARRSRNPASTQARKIFKRTVEATGITMNDALYEIDLHPGLFDHVTRQQPVVQYPAQVPTDATTVPPAIDDGMTTMTGLPNADGHRVAMMVLQRMQQVGIVRGIWSLATPPRRVDRFNTGACHVNFTEVDDALRVQQALRQFPLFASFRDGVLTIGHAAH